MTEDWTLDGFLGGRLRIAQPKRGFRAGHDTVLLAASVPAEDGAQVLELGAGAGVSSLCLAARVTGARVLGIEIDPFLVGLANENAARNAMAGRVHFERGEVTSLSAPDRSFDHVFFNPPFHPATGQESYDARRTLAMRDTANAIDEWTRIALSLVGHGGTVTAIVRADRANDVISAGSENEVVLFPLLPRAGEAPKRAIVRIAKREKETLRVAAGLVLHEQDGGNTEAAEAVLRHGAPLRLA